MRDTFEKTLINTLIGSLLFIALMLAVCPIISQGLTETKEFSEIIILEIHSDAMFNDMVEAMIENSDRYVTY